MKKMQRSNYYMQYNIFYRSSQDEYCPSENVDQIQVGVLEELRQHLGDIDVQLAYLKEETH